MKTPRLRRNSNSHKILKAAALGAGFLIVSLLSPASGAAVVQKCIKGYFRKKSFERLRFLRDLKKLQERKLIEYQDLGNGKVKITLTKSGKQKVLLYQLENIKLQRQNRWDGKWRLILFDIPHNHKQGRDAFRKKLNDLNFYPLQKSVFITPCPCEDEVDFLASIFDVQNYILLLYVSAFEGEEKLKHHFRIG